MPETYTLPAGSIVKRNGMPVVLMTPTLIQCEPGMWPLVRDAAQPAVSPVTRADRAADKDCMAAVSMQSLGLTEGEEEAFQSMPARLTDEESGHA